MFSIKGYRNIASKALVRRNLHTTTLLQSPRFVNSNFNSRTRVTKEISPEEVRQFQEAQARARDKVKLHGIHIHINLTMTHIIHSIYLTTPTE